MNYHNEPCIKHIVSLAVLLGIVILSLCGCESGHDVEKVTEGTENLLDNDMRITITHCYNPEKYDGLSHIVFDSLKEEWIGTHPEIRLEESVLPSNAYYTAITGYASQDRLPDIFFIPHNNLKIWSDWGYLADIAEYADEPESEMPSLQYGEVYAFNSVLSTPVLVAYDILTWREAGYDSFPKTWEKLAQTISVFGDIGYDFPLSVPEMSGSIASHYLMQRIYSENCGVEWTCRLISGEESCLFLENGVKEALKELHWITDSGIMKEDSHYVEAYLDNRCPAVLITLEDIPKLMKDSSKWESTAFALLPVSSESKYGNEIANTYYATESYVPVINSKIAEDTEKMKVCVDFCRFVTENSAGKYETEYLKTTGSDTAKNLNSILSNAEKTYNFIYYIDSSTLEFMYNEIEIWLDTDAEEIDSYTAQKTANALQNGYEKYLNWDYH